jgi:cytochrome P450
MAACSAAALEGWQGRSEAFDACREMMALTLDVIARTMFSTDVSGDEAGRVRGALAVCCAIRCRPERQRCALR